MCMCVRESERDSVWERLWRRSERGNDGNGDEIEWSQWQEIERQIIRMKIDQNTHARLIIITKQKQRKMHTALCTPITRDSFH